MGYKPAYIWNGTSWDQIGNQAVASLDSYALLTPAVGQNITNTTLTSASINSASVSGTVTLSGTISGGTLLSNTIDSAYFISPGEKITVSGSSASGAINYDIKTQGIFYYSASATGNTTINFRGDGSTTLNSLISTNESISVLMLMTQGATAYYPTAFTIDGVSVTPKWSGGTAPTSGNTNSIDAYSFTIVKTASATYTVFAAQGKYA